MFSLFKDSGRLIIVCAIALLLPAGVVYYRNQPYNADTADELLSKVVRHERPRMESTLGQRRPSSMTLAESQERWRVLHKSMLEQGATQSEVATVLRVIKSYLPTVRSGMPAPHLPILVKRGYVRGKTVWVGVCAAQNTWPGNSNRNSWTYWVRAVNPQNPNEVQDTFSSNLSFVRCDDPTSPSC